LKVTMTAPEGNKGGGKRKALKKRPWKPCVYGGESHGRKKTPEAWGGGVAGLGNSTKGGRGGGGNPQNKPREKGWAPCWRKLG